MARSSPTRWPQWPGFRGWLGSYYPFYKFQQLAREDGKPYEPPEPEVERQLLSLLGTKPAVTVMTCLLVVVAFTLIVLMVARLA